MDTAFLIKAKKHTYADAGSEKITPSRLGSSDYEFTAGDLSYHDTYFGGTNFQGNEVVYQGQQPIWGMVYHGVTLDPDYSEAAMDAALRPAMMQVGTDPSVLPVRGPREYINGDYRYTFECQGDINNFTGTERIYHGTDLIYELHCAGGQII